ncbi:MAG: YidC/Oxa1 family membrane protein insertase [Patescibacteria group bacterium]
MIELYNNLVHEPLLNVLILFYNTIAFQNFGLAIIFLTIFIRIILYPLFQKNVRHQNEMQKLQPKIRKAQEAHKGNREKQAQVTMELYKEHNVKPFSGILILLVQMPVIIALFQIAQSSFTPETFAELYSFVKAPIDLNTSFLGLINLKESSIVGNNFIVLILAALAQYFQAKLSLPPQKPGHEVSRAEKIGRQMVFITPGFTIVVLAGLPATVALYWLTTSLVTIIQQKVINKKIKREHGELGNIREKNN